MDSALIVDGIVIQVWRDTASADLPAQVGEVVEFEAGQVVCGQLWNGSELSLPSPPPPTAPAQVAMHRVKKAALLTPWNGFANLLAAINTAITALPAPSNELAAIEFASAPNLVRDGLTTAAVMAELGMTEAQRDELLIFAASLP